MKLTELLAIYGACLSTVVFFWNLVRSRPRFKVKVLVASDKEDPTRFAGAHILVQNVSTTVVHIFRISVLYPYMERTLLFKEITPLDRIKHRIKYVLRYRRLPLNSGWMSVRLQDYGVEDGCPIVLEPGKIHQVLFPRDAFKEMPYFGRLRRVIRVVAEDRFWGNSVCSNILEVPIFKDTVPVTVNT